MNEKLRIHIRITSKDLVKDWTFDHPKKVTIGFSPSASIWLASSEAGPETVLFTRTGREVRLRIENTLQGNLKIQGQEISLNSLKEVGLLKRDSMGDYVSVVHRTMGTFLLPDNRIEFWITPSPKEPEFPLQPKIVSLAHGISWLFALCFFFAVTTDIGIVYYFRSLPPIPEPTVQEIAYRYSRISIPPMLQEEIRKQSSPQASEEASESKTQTQRQANQPLPKSSGILAAVVHANSQGKRSPFSGLFSSDSIGSQIGSDLLGGNFEKIVSAKLKGSSPRNGSDLAPQTVGIGEVKGETRSVGSLQKTSETARVANLSVEYNTTTASIDRSQLEMIVSSHAGEIRDCYEKSLVRDPKLSGKAVFRLILTSVGKPSIVLDPSSTLNDAGLARCAIDRMAAWPFPVPAKNTDPILLPFVFSTTSKG